MRVTAFLAPVLFVGLTAGGCGTESPTTPESPEIRAPRGDELAEFTRLPNRAGGITVMTRNVYVGANVDAVLGASNPELIPQLVAEAFQQLLSTNFPERAEALAEEIDRTRPHLIGLQEISLIRRQSPGDAVVGGTVPAEELLFDYLEILMDALANRGLHYRVAGMIQNADVEVPMVTSLEPLAFDDIRLTDFDVVLARSDVSVFNVTEANYQTKLPVPDLGIEIPRGFVALSARVGRKIYRFVNTHLEPASIPEILPVQLGQAQELVGMLQGERNPVILVGDLNTQATSGATYQYLVSEGYVDVWTRNLLRWHNPNGYTSNHDSDLRNEEVDLHQRIDFIFVKSHARKWNRPVIGPVLAVVLGDELEDRTPSGLWPSDHAGVVARLRIPVTPLFGGR